MDVESRSELFCIPKTSFQENVLVNDAIPPSTNWTLVTKGNWQLLDRIVQNLKCTVLGIEFGVLFFEGLSCSDVA